MSEAESTSVQYSRWTPVVRTALAAVPYAGGALATAWSEWDTARRFKRVEHTLAELGRLLAELRAVFDPQRIGEPEMQILEAVLDKAQSEHRENKRCQFAKLVASDWTVGQDSPFEDRMRFVRALDELDDLHIQILAYLARQADAGKMPSYTDIAEAMQIPPNERDGRLIPALHVLASSYGFLRRGWGMSSGESHLVASDNLSPEGIARRCEHTITDGGRRFLRAVSLPNE